MAAEITTELTELRSVTERADVAVGTAIRNVVAEERDRLACELELALRTAHSLRNQLEALGFCFH